MPVWKPLTRLGLLGILVPVALSACATWPGYRAPQGPHGPSPDVVVTATPPGGDPAAAPSAADPQPHADAAIEPSISVPGPPVAVPAAQTHVDSTVSGPAASAAVPVVPPAAPPVAPPDAPEAPPRKADVAPLETTAPAAESNRDQLQPQKPLEVVVSGSDPSVPGRQAEGVAGPDQPVATVNSAPNSAATQKSATPPANRPPGALAKLRARFHKLIQPSSKPVPKPSKEVKPSDPAVTSHDPTPAVARVRIPLPMSDESRLVKDDPRAVHGLYPVEEGQALSTAATRDAQPRVTTANAAPGSMDGLPPQEAAEKSAAPGQIEQWPYSPQAAVNAPIAASVPTSANEFDPVPVEEYQAAVAKVNGDANSLPAFGKAPAASNEGAHAASASPKSAAPAPAPLATEPRIVPTVSAPLIRIDQAAARPVATPQNSASQPLDLDDRPETEPSTQLPLSAAPQTESAPASGSTAPVDPAVQTSALVPAPPLTVRPAQVPAVRSPQWIGGRYGQPAWMAAPYMTPATTGTGN